MGESTRVESLVYSKFSKRLAFEVARRTVRGSWPLRLSTPSLRAKFIQSRGRAGEVAGHEHVPIIVALNHFIQETPAIFFQSFRQIGRRVNVNESVGNDGELAVLLGNIEVVDDIAGMVNISRRSARGD
jgi:hypothetical protein